MVLSDWQVVLCEWDSSAMKNSKNIYSGYRYPKEIISHAVWLYYRFTLSFRDIDEILAVRGVVETYETIRQWCMKFGQVYGKRIKRNRGSLGDIWFLDEVFIKINGNIFGEQ